MLVKAQCRKDGRKILPPTFFPQKNSMGNNVYKNISFFTLLIITSKLTVFFAMINVNHQNFFWVHQKRLCSILDSNVNDTQTHFRGQKKKSLLNHLLLTSFSKISCYFILAFFLALELLFLFCSLFLLVFLSGLSACYLWCLISLYLG